jgi:hypothetical protein
MGLELGSQSYMFMVVEVRIIWSDFSSGMDYASIGKARTFAHP